MPNLCRQPSWIALSFAAIVSSAAPAADPPVAKFSVDVLLGDDLGQPFGSLFEVRDASGRVVAGAGFSEVYNTHFRGNRRTLQCFVRPPGPAVLPTVERLPHPDLDTGAYLFGVDEDVFAWSSVRGNTTKRWDAALRAWQDGLPADCGVIRSGDGAMRLGHGMLAMSNNRAAYDGREILAPPAQGRYSNFYYGAGHLCFYHTVREGPDAATRILACPWRPRDAGPVSPAKAFTLTTKYVGETPFSWGQFDGRVLTVSNMGGVYIFDGRTWQTLLEPDDKVSYQVYSMLNFYDRLLLAQYPTGELFEYRGEGLKRLEGWPPRLPGVSPSAREAQTMAIYGGDLLVGVWPWAELWRYDHDRDAWQSWGRMFSHPEVTDEQVHPYESEAEQLGLVANHWGQRVTAMIASGEALLLSTSSKGTSAWSADYDFLTEAQRREYGAVMRLVTPGNVAAQIAFGDEPTRLEFILFEDRLAIHQDGRELASAPWEHPEGRFLDAPSMRWGYGVFGPFGGSRIEPLGTRP